MEKEKKDIRVLRVWGVANQIELLLQEKNFNRFISWLWNNELGVEETHKTCFPRLKNWFENSIFVWIFSFFKLSKHLTYDGMPWEHKTFNIHWSWK
jgi:hypothetical protein